MSDKAKTRSIPALTIGIIESFSTGDHVTFEYFNKMSLPVTTKGTVAGIVCKFRPGFDDTCTITIRQYRSRHVLNFRDGDLVRITQGWDFAAENKAAEEFGKRFSKAMFGSKPVRRFEDILPATVTITCHLCGSQFEAMMEKTDLADNYTLLEDGTYDGSAADHWCNRCEEDDRTSITRAWRYR